MKASIAIAAALALSTATTSYAQQLAHLEPQTGILFGAWVDTVGGTDTFSLTNKRMTKPLSFFQANFNLPDENHHLPQLLQEIDQTGTDAILYLTIYPMSGFQAVTDASINELADELAAATQNGRRILIRYAPEMNGSWFAYGQDPASFIPGWKRFVDIIRSRVPDLQKVAFLWAPNSSNGYPFPGGEHSPTSNATIALMDTNKDGKFDFYDDPYSPYYPGDNYVDWVGLSMYHYGKEYPWMDNVLPQPGTVEAMLTGQPPMSSYSFYQMFSGDGRGPNVTSPVSRGSKPFMVAETAATFHLTFLSDQSAVNPGPGMLAIKKAWWEQIFNTNFLAKFPKIKGVCTFEFKKDEEYTVREFRSLGDKDADNGKAENEENQVLRAFRDHLFGMGNQIVWATQTGKDTSSALAVKGALAVSVAGTMLASLAFLF